MAMKAQSNKSQTIEVSQGGKKVPTLSA